MRRLVLAEGALAPGRWRAPDDLGHYVRRVLRAQGGDRLALTDGAGVEAIGELLQLDPLVMSVSELKRVPAPDFLITLIQAVGKRDKIDGVVRQAAELGATRVQVVTTERTVAERTGRLSRWRTIADDALRVAGGAHRMEVGEVRPLAEILAEPRADRSYVLALGGAEGLPAQVEARQVEILIGPEGGLTEEEIAAAEAVGFQRATLGKRTLRTETAGPAALAILLHAAGRLSP